MTESDVQGLIDRRDIIDVVTALFVATDEMDWDQIVGSFADPVILDMTSLAGGEPSRLTPAQVAAGWRDGLAKVDHVHHQVGNFRVHLHGDEADVSCYGIALHHRNITGPDNLRTFVGTYDMHLMRAGGRWRIDLFRFNSKFVTGNLQLESAT